MFSFFKKLDKHSRSIILICYFSFFCNGAFSLIIGSAMPDLKAAYGISDTASGLLLSAHSIGNLIAGFVSALIPLFLGERKAIMALSSLAVIGFVMMILWGNPVWLFLAFILTGFTRGSVTNFDNRTINRITDGSGSAANCLHASFALGAILSPMIFLGLSRAISWRAALLSMVVFLCISIFNLSRMRLDNEYPDRKDKANRSFVFLRNPSYLILMFMLFCYVCSEYAINGWLVTYIQNKEELLVSFGKSGEELELAVKAYSQTMATLFWVLMLTGRLACAALTVRISEKKLLLICSVGVMGFFLMMLLSSTVPTVSIAVSALGLCMAGMSPMIYADSAGFSNKYPMAVSGLIVFSSFGSILMNTVIGILSDHFGFQGGMSAITVTVVLLVVFSLLNVVVKPKEP